MLTYEDETHIYRLDGEAVPSVTELISPVTEEDFSKIPPDVLANAARRGTEVHSLCEMIDYGMDISESVTEETAPFVDAYMRFLSEHKCEWTWIEHPGVCTWFPIDFAGTVDRYGVIDGKPAVLDIKTVQSPNVTQKACTSMQTYAYSCIACEATDTVYWESDAESITRYALYLKKDGKYMLVDLNAFDEKEDFDAAERFCTLIRLYREKQDVLAPFNDLKQKHTRKKKV